MKATWLQGTRHALAHASLLLVPLLLLYVHGRDRERETAASRLAAWLAAPGQAAVGGAVRGVAEGWRRYAWLVDTQADNEALRARADAAELDLRLLTRRLSAAERRAEMCGFRFAREDLVLAPARVVGQELGPLDQVLRLAVELPDPPTAGGGGVSDGAWQVPTDASVITPRGLIGRVARTAGRLAEVELVTDARARIHARAAVRGVLGTVRGMGPGDRHGLRFETTEGQARLSEGDPVVTSGHDRRYVPGMVIGVIASDEARQQGLKLEYAVTPAVPLWEVREAFVVLGRNPTAEP